MTKIIKEHTHTGSIESGTAKGSENQYIGTNMMSYEDDNGDKLRYIQQAHLDHHNQALGFNHFNPTQISVARNHHLKSNTVMNEASTARIKVKAKLNELGLQLGKLNELGDYVKDGMASPGYTGNDDPAPQTIRKNDQLEEGPKLDKAKKVAMAGMTAANIYTLGDVMSKASSGHGSPKSDIVRAASTLPGAAGWAATGVHYAKKAYDKVKHMKEENKYPDTSERGIYEKAPPGDKFERMVKHIKSGYAKDGKLTKKEKGIAFATAWKAKKKEENMEEGYASIGHSFDWAGDVNHRAKFYGKKPKPTTTKNDEKDDTYKDSKQGGKVKFAKTVKEENLDEVSLGKLVRYKREREKDVRANEISSSHSQSMADAHKGHDDKKHKEWSDEAKWLRGHGERMKKGIALADKKMKGKAKVNASAPKHPYMEEQIDELKAETLGSYTKKAAASRKKSLEGSQPDIKTWAKRQKGITTAVKKLTSEAGSQDRDYDEASGFSEQTPSHLHLNKPDTKYAPGAAGITHTIHEETTMENQNLINEAIENILDNDLVAMKENLMVALQEKAQEKLEEKKKAIAANYFAQ